MPNIELKYTYKVDGKIPTQVIQNMRYTLSNGTEVRGETVSLDYEYTK